jgi:hypothetical protein
VRSIPKRRSEYLIDRHHVTFDPGTGWQCLCVEFKATGDCGHVRESQGRHAAQAVIADRMRSPLTQSGHRLKRD